MEDACAEMLEHREISNGVRKISNDGLPSYPSWKLKPVAQGAGEAHSGPARYIGIAISEECGLVTLYKGDHSVMGFAKSEAQLVVPIHGTVLEKGDLVEIFQSSYFFSSVVKELNFLSGDLQLVTLADCKLRVVLQLPLPIGEWMAHLHFGTTRYRPLQVVQVNSSQHYRYNDEHWFLANGIRYLCDVAPGDSGAVVVIDGKVVGVHVCGDSTGVAGVAAEYPVQSISSIKSINRSEFCAHGPSKPNHNKNDSSWKILGHAHEGIPDDGLPHSHIHSCVRCDGVFVHTHVKNPTYVSKKFPLYCRLCRIAVNQKPVGGDYVDEADAVIKSSCQIDTTAFVDMKENPVVRIPFRESSDRKTVPARIAVCTEGVTDEERKAIYQRVTFVYESDCINSRLRTMCCEMGSLALLEKELKETEFIGISSFITFEEFKTVINSTSARVVLSQALMKEIVEQLDHSRACLDTSGCVVCLYRLSVQQLVESYKDTRSSQDKVPNVSVDTQLSSESGNAFAYKEIGNNVAQAGVLVQQFGGECEARTEEMKHVGDVVDDCGMVHLLCDGNALMGFAENAYCVITPRHDSDIFVGILVVVSQANRTFTSHVDRIDLLSGDLQRVVLAKHELYFVDELPVSLGEGMVHFHQGTTRFRPLSIIDYNSSQHYTHGSNFWHVANGLRYLCDVGPGDSGAIVVKDRVVVGVHVCGDILGKLGVASEYPAKLYCGDVFIAHSRKSEVIAMQDLRRKDF